MNEKIPLGHFVWYECLTTDPTGAEAFYTKLTRAVSTPLRQPDSAFTVATPRR